MAADLHAADLLPLIDGAITAGGLVILTFHAVGPRDFPRLHITEDEHVRLIEGISARRSDLWAAPLVDIVAAIESGRQEP